MPSHLNRNYTPGEELHKAEVDMIMEARVVIWLAKKYKLGLGAKDINETIDKVIKIIYKKPTLVKKERIVNNVAVVLGIKK